MTIAAKRTERPITIESRGLYKKLAVVALPMAMQEIISCSLTLVDNLMIGSLGEAELSAVGVGVQLFFVHWMMIFGFTSGTATYMAQFYGSKDIRNIRKTAGLALVVCMIISAVFFSAAFLRLILWRGFFQIFLK